MSNIELPGASREGIVEDKMSMCGKVFNYCISVIQSPVTMCISSTKLPSTVPSKHVASSALSC